jgi:nitrogen fixation/metabolism regulation signal transduction histidine kinase
VRDTSLAPIKSIAASLFEHLRPLAGSAEREDFERGLEVIQNRAESLNRFLQAYRHLMGLPTPKLTRVELTDLIHHVAQLETRLTVCTVVGDEIMVFADPDQLQQALINLVRNAAEALGPDCENRERAQVEVGWNRAGNDVTITITDNGIGLTNESNLFVPFYTTKPSGTGIGLVVAQ